jgi:GDP-4-dehydro-6-deoxy-D-mannose reductase
MRILITGATGFVGCHLAEALLAVPNTAIFGLSLRHGWPGDIQRLGQQVRLIHGDLCDTTAVAGILSEVCPDHIYHLAGYADIGRSFQEADAAWTGNLTATRSLYEAVLRWGGNPRLLYVSSGAVYGEPQDPKRAVDEATILQPNSPYAASKAAADLASYQYTRSHGLHIVRARPFNHVGPGQSARFALAHFAWQIAAIERGSQPPKLRVGNLWTERDLTDVRDIVLAYLRLMEQAPSGEVYNIGSGQTLPMKVFLDRLLALSSVSIEVESAPELVRKVETATVRVNADKLRQATGWTPRYSLDQTLSDLLTYCRSHPP